jgi:hypothetical protein
MPRGEYTGSVKKAKRKQKIKRMIDMYPDEAERLTEMYKAINAELSAAGACLYCGRGLSGTDEFLGKDCRAKLESEGLLEDWLKEN